MPSPDEELERAKARLPAATVAIEAYWDGDTSGWFVVLVAVVKGDTGYEDTSLWSSEGNDFRLFNGQTPPWGEARRAAELGPALAAALGVPFYFPSPDHPEDDCPRWWERDQGTPCRRCGVQLLQRDPCPWRGVCYYCHLAEEKEAREAAWSPEERVGPRCELCGKPAQAGVDGPQRCPACLDRYDDYQCTRCSTHVCILKALEHTDVCDMCDLRERFAEAPETDRQTIQAAAHQGEGSGLLAARRILGWPLSDAISLVHMIRSGRA
jgi:hypothetical protein